MKTVSWIFILIGAAIFGFALWRNNQTAASVQPQVTGNATQPNLSGPNQSTLDWARPTGIDTGANHWFPQITINL